MPTVFGSKVLKTKYFSSTNFLNAKTKRNASFIWKSFMAVQHIIREGLIWNIGNGESVQLWHNKWIPKPTIYKIQSPIRI